MNAIKISWKPVCEIKSVRAAPFWSAMPFSLNETMQKTGHFPQDTACRFFVATLLLFFTGTAFSQGYYPRSYRKPARTELSDKSKKGIERILGEDDAVRGKKNNALNQAKAETETYRLKQEKEMDAMLGDREAGEDTPGYMVRAMQAYRFTGDRNVKRFADAASEFQLQELREEARGYLKAGDVENYNRVMALISGKPYAPYSSVKDSGYVVNRSTGEISVGNPHAASLYDRKTRADTEKKQADAASQHARTKAQAEKAASGTSRAGPRQKTGASGLTETEYREARKKAAAAERPDLVSELDGMAQQMGYQKSQP